MSTQVEKPTNSNDLRALAAKVILEARDEARSLMLKGLPHNDGLARLQQALEIRRRYPASVPMLVSRHEAQGKFKLFLSQSFNKKFKKDVRASVAIGAERFQMEILAGDEDEGRGATEQEIVSKIKARILECDVFLCVITPLPPKWSWISDNKQNQSSLESWYVFETALAYAYNKPYVIVSHSDRFEATKNMFNWTEVRCFQSLDFNESEFKSEINNALASLDRVLGDQLKRELLD